MKLPYNYWPRRRRLEVWEMMGLKIGVWKADLELYPWPFDWIFDRSLHFVSRLDVDQADEDSPGASEAQC